jgi:hypothetical protein
VDWLDQNAGPINEIRPAEGWPTTAWSLPVAVRSAAVVHILLVPTSTEIIDVVPLTASSWVSGCTSVVRGAASYQISVHGEPVASFVFPDPLHLATWGSALLMTRDDLTYQRLLAAGASATSCAVPIPTVVTGTASPSG